MRKKVGKEEKRLTMAIRVVIMAVASLAVGTAWVDAEETTGVPTAEPISRFQLVVEAPTFVKEVVEDIETPVVLSEQDKEYIVVKTEWGEAVPYDDWEFDPNSYENNAALGNAVVIVRGRGEYAGYSGTFGFSIKKNIGFSNEVTLGTVEYRYTGNEVKVKPNVKHKGRTLKQGVDYQLEYVNNVKAGWATVKVVGMGDYSGIAELDYEIVKADAMFVNLKRGRFKIKCINLLGVTRVKLIYEDPTIKYKGTREVMKVSNMQCVSKKTFYFTSEANKGKRFFVLEGYKGKKSLGTIKKLTRMVK